MWLIGSFCGAFTVVLGNTLSKLWGLNTYSAIIIGFIGLLATYFYWFSFRNSSHFLTCWFVNSALVATGGFIANKYVVKQALSPYQIAGIALIILGALTLKWK